MSIERGNGHFYIGVETVVKPRRFDRLRRLFTRVEPITELDIVLNGLQQARELSMVHEEQLRREQPAGTVFGGIQYQFDGEMIDRIITALERAQTTLRIYQRNYLLLEVLVWTCAGLGAANAVLIMLKAVAR